MHRIDTSDNTNILPEPTAPGPKPNGYFRKPNAIEGIKGTILDTEWVNMVQEELCNAVLASGATLAKNNRSQLADAMRTLSLTKFAVTSGVNAYVCTIPGVTTYVPGLTIYAVIAATNTGASSLKVNELAAIPIVNTNGSIVFPGSLLVGATAQLVFNGGQFVLINPNYTSGKFVGLVGMNVYAATIPGLTAYYPGLMVNALVSQTNTAGSSLNINNLGAVPIGTTVGNALQAFDMVAGSVCQLFFNGSIFQLLNHSKLQASAKLIGGGGSFPNSGTFAVPFGVIEYSSPNIAVNPGAGLIQAVVPGLYEVKANLGFINLDTATQVIAEIHWNGMAVASTGMPETALSTRSRALSVPIHTELYMNIGDSVRLVAYIPFSRQNLGVDAGRNRTFLSLRRVQT